MGLTKSRPIVMGSLVLHILCSQIDFFIGVLWGGGERQCQREPLTGRVLRAGERTDKVISASPANPTP